MKYLALIFPFMTFNTQAFNQEPAGNDCYEIKYLDYFGLDHMEVVKWKGDEMIALEEMDFETHGTDPTIRTNFIIPIIVCQLRTYHPDCQANIDTNSFGRLVSVYHKIRNIPKGKTARRPIEEQIDFMRADYYRQVENDTFLAYMVYTLDDGPFYGIDVDNPDSLAALKVLATDFGKLVISESGEKIILTGIDQKGNRIWQKALTGLSGRYLTSLCITENPVERTSLATRIHLFAEGERLTVHIRNDGKFMYYFHSW